TLVAMIPISVNGWGLQEGSMLYLLDQFGVASGVALALPLIVRVNVTSYALIGGVIYFFDRGDKRDAAAAFGEVEAFDVEEAILDEGMDDPVAEVEGVTAPAASNSKTEN
ncbi:MAG: flippase-like domain-containing protein, partial [Firmicutes bacterium]|nr:flippase-like domain-containing protein [Bacillota bacterium]